VLGTLLFALALLTAGVGVRTFASGRTRES
jgi:hypothetical protein